MPIINTISNLVSEQSAFSVALLLGLEPVGVALGAGEDEGRALVLFRVVVPVRDPLLTGAWNPQNETLSPGKPYRAHSRWMVVTDLL